MSKIVVANIQNYSMIGQAVASVVASTTKVETAHDYAAKVESLFGGKLEIVPNSVRNVTASEQLPAVAFHLRAKTENLPIEAAAQMREVITANVFADADDATWSVVEAQPGVKRLVKQTDTDVSALLAAASRSNLHRIAASNYDAGVGAVYAGEFAIFTNPETASVDTGIVTYGDDGGMVMLSRSTGNLVPVTHDAIVAHSAFEVEAEEGDKVEETAAFTKRDAAPLVDYYRKLFSSQPAFFAKLEAMIRRRFLLA